MVKLVAMRGPILHQSPAPINHGGSLIGLHGGVSHHVRERDLQHVVLIVADIGAPSAETGSEAVHNVGHTHSPQKLGERHVAEWDAFRIREH